jgi:hypothetical protein
MRKVSLSLIPVFVALLSLSAYAQERDVKTGGAGKEETLKLTINGGWNVGWVHVSGDLIDMSFGNTSEPQAESVITGNVYLDIHASLQEKIDLHLRISNVNMIGGPQKDTGSSEVLGLAPLEANGPGPILEIDEAYVTIAEVFDPAITLTFGLHNVVFDVRGSGDPMMLALGHCEDPWATMDAYSNSGEYPGTTHDESGFAGMSFAYTREKYQIGVGILQNSDDSGARYKERVFYANAIFDVTEDGSQVGIIAVWSFGSGVWNSAGEEEDILTFGVSANVHVATDIDVFAEVYINTGTYDSNPGGTDEDAAGMAWRIGGHIEFPGNTPAWAELSIKNLSGMDSTESDEREGFFSYENDDDMLFYDSNEWGIDLDQNIMMIKIKAGVTLTNGIVLIGKLAMVDLVEDDDGSITDDSLGMEFNATLEYPFTKNAKVYLTLGLISGGDYWDYLNCREDGGMMFLFGTQADF